MKYLILFVLLVAVVLSLLLILPTTGAVAEAETECSTAAEPSEPPETSFDEKLMLRVLDGGAVTEMSLHDYLIGVVSAELPEGFPMEAQKAQAVAARTFTLYHAQRKKHPNADVCTDSACCQGYAVGTSEAAREAVEETDGCVATYDGELIDATYFSCAAGRTEAAVAVWGSDVPYLQSVESPNEESAPRYSETVVMYAETFAEHLQVVRPEANFEGEASRWFGKITYTRGGGIDTAILGGAEFSGNDLRTALSLRSTNIEFSVNGDEITVTTYGFGHRVGMSQYGAKAMAESGSSFEEILKTYYQGIALRRMELSDGTGG